MLQTLISPSQQRCQWQNWPSGSRESWCPAKSNHNNYVSDSNTCRFSLCSPFSWWFPLKCRPWCTLWWSWASCPCRGPRWTWARWDDQGNATPSPGESNKKLSLRSQTTSCSLRITKCPEEVWPHSSCLTWHWKPAWTCRGANIWICSTDL